MIADINQTLKNIPSDIENKRGMQIYTLSQLQAITGQDKNNQRLTVTHDQSLFYLNYNERNDIFRLCTPVHAVVSSRMNIISSMDFEIICDKKEEDRIYEQLKNYKSIYDEYVNSTEEKYVVARAVMLRDIRSYLPDCLPDLSNFKSCLLRWKKRNQNMKYDKSDEIKEWLMQPNANDSYEEFIKKSVYDLLIHGSLSVYKETLNNVIENIYLLPGGSVMPIKNEAISGINGYIQVMQGWQEPKIYFDDELSYSTYLPTTSRGYGMIPLEALINKVAETLFFDELMASQADGTKPPEKMIVITDPSPFGDLKQEFKVPVDEAEQKRIEEKVNEPIKNAIMTFAGSNVQVVDLSRENTMDFQNSRQKDIREEVGLIFQATPIEMNLAGSENTSGRSTSEIQRELYHSKGILPIIKILTSIFDRDIFPYRFGTGYKIDFQLGKNELEELEILQRKVATGLYSTNELREEKGEQPFDDEQFDKPSGSMQPDGSDMNPIAFKQIK